MKQLLIDLSKFLLEGLKAMNWRDFLYKACKGTFLPLLSKKVNDSQSKIDDVIYKGLEQLVDKFLAPEQPKLEAPHVS